MVTQDDVLAVVHSSPRLVRKHDRAGWIALYADDYVIEDPVGSRPVRGDAIGPFWDTFIATNDIVFEVHRDWPDGLTVVRDVTITTTLPTGAQVRTPAHLIYELVETDAGLRIRRMAAYWEPLPMFAQIMKPRLAYVRAGLSMFVRMLRHLGPGGTVAFVGAVRSVGRRGKRAVEEHLRGKVDNLHKVIAAGNVVTANATVDGRPAAVIAMLDRRTRAVLDYRIYT
jgi:hypothetical protein